MNTSNRHYKALFLSDIHLGCKDCKTEYLKAFLQSVSADTIYLLGDIFDLWAMKRRNDWQPSHTEIVQILKDKADSGTRIVYVPGNHDDAMRSFPGLGILNVELHLETTHETADGEKLLLIHGDRFDGLICCAPFLTWLGDKSYEFLLFLNRWNFRINRLLSRPYWSLASYIKLRVSKACEALYNFRKVAVGYAKENGYDGIICGHIHHPELTHIDGILYGNCGDWVENCTMLVENESGELQLVRWADRIHAITRLNAKDRNNVAQAA